MAVEAQPDLITGVRSYLLNTALVAAEVVDRVYGGGLPRALIDGGAQPAVAVRGAGGSGSYGGGYQQYGDQRVDVLCYGETSREARTVYDIVCPVLKQMRRNRQGACLLHWANQAGGPLDLIDPDTDWPFVFSSWQVCVAEVAAT